MLGMMVYICSPSYAEGIGRRIMAWAKSEKPYLKGKAK
jgi:hypothetical protein